MRAKQLLSRIPVPDKVKLVYVRLTLNKLTTIYFVVAIVHCVVQVIFQLAAHAINVNARHLMSHILTQARLTMDKFAIVETKRTPALNRRTDLTLTLCMGIPGQFGLTGKDVCNVLWSQSKGLVKDTLEEFLSPSSDDGQESNSDSDSDSDDDKTKTESQTSTLSRVATALPAIAFTSTSSVAATTSTSASSASRSSTSSILRATTSFSTSLATSTSNSVLSSTSTSLVSSTSTSLRVVPTPVGNLIQPDSPSSDSNDEKSPPSNNDDSPSSDDDKLVPARVRVRRAKVSANKIEEGKRRVFDREKLRPLSLPPRPGTPSQPLQERDVDIDETHPDLEAHRRHARVSPITSERLRRAQLQDKSTVEFVPIAPKRTYDPKKFVLSRSTRTTATPVRRALSFQDRQSVTVTPIFEIESDSHDEKKKASGALSLNGQPKEKLVAVRLSGLAGPGMGNANLATTNSSSDAFGDVELTPGCALALAWPAQVLRDFAHEDLAMIGFQVWLLGMTVVAILNESVPHMVAGLVTQALSTGWSAFQMARSSSFRAQYEATIVRGACAGVDILPDYFGHRTQDEIPIVVLNAIFLVTMIGLSWKICRVYGWQTFKRIGASRVMNRAYQLVLAFSIHLQLAVFFFVTSSALWVDALLNGPIACFAEHRTIYEGVFITSVLLLLPWLILGWIGVRRENKLMMHVFLFISLLYITAWAAMFASDVYRWTFATWPFFAAMTVVSYVVLVATTGLAVVCRYNFKKGLALFLKSQQVLPGAEFSDVLPTADPEKVEFPTHRPGELPTFSLAYGQRGQPVHPSQIAAPVPAITRNVSARTAVSVRTQEQGTAPAGYSVNPYSNGSAHFWGDEGTKSNTDSSVHDTYRTAQASDIDVPAYTLEPEPQTLGVRELPQWEEVRRSQLPSDFRYPQITTPAAQPALPAIPSSQLQYESHQFQADNSSVYTSSTGQFEVLRDGRWVQIDARELYRASVGTHVSAGGASRTVGDDVAPLPTRPPMPTVQVPQQASPPMAARAAFGLPGKNIRPQKTGLGGRAVPTGW